MRKPHWRQSIRTRPTKKKTPPTSSSSPAPTTPTPETTTSEPQGVAPLETLDPTWTQEVPPPTLVWKAAEEGDEERLGTFTVVPTPKTPDDLRDYKLPPHCQSAFAPSTLPDTCEICGEIAANHVRGKDPEDLSFEPVVAHVTFNNKPVNSVILSYDAHRGYLVTCEQSGEVLWAVGTEEEARARANAYLEGWQRALAYSNES
jgi:hypothetical protein